MIVTIRPPVSKLVEPVQSQQVGRLIIPIGKKSVLSTVTRLESKEEQKPMSPLFARITDKHILNLIFEFAGGKDALRVMLAIAKDKSATEIKDNLINGSHPNLIDSPITPSILTKIIKKYLNIRFEGLNIIFTDSDNIMDWDLLASTPQRKSSLKYLAIVSSKLDLNILPKFPNLISLKIRGIIVNWIGLNVCKKLQQLNIEYSTLNTQNINLSEISKISSLQQLHLSLSSSQEDQKFSLDLGILNNIPNLTTVRIDKFTILNNIAFPKCKSLTQLELHRCNYDNSLPFLSDDYQLITLILNLPINSIFTNIQGIITQQKLQTFELRDVDDISSNYLNNLAQCKTLTTIYVRQYSTYNVRLNLNFITLLPQLTSFTIIGNIESLEPLERCYALKILNIKYLGAGSDIYLPIVKDKYKGLTSLTLDNIPHHKDICSLIAKHTLLTYLNINVPYPISKLNDLAPLHKMEKLSISYNTTNELNFIGDMPELKELELDSVGEDFTFPQKSGAKLQKFTVKNRSEFTSLNGLQIFTSLQHLDLYAPKLTNISVLDQLTTLESLDLRHANDLEDFTITRKMPMLKEIGLTDANLVRFTGLHYCPNLTNLHIYGGSIKDISAIGECYNLTTLTITLTNIPNNISALSNCKKLEYISIQNISQLSDITPLSKCFSLKRIVLIRLQILSKIISLAKLPELENIDLYECNMITDFDEFVKSVNSNVLISSPSGNVMRGKKQT